MVNGKILPRIHDILHDNGGETLLELVLSIGLFGLTMLMVASMFAAASRVTVHSYNSEKEIDERITALSEGNYTQESMQPLVFYDKSGNTAGTAQIVRLVEKDGFYKFVADKP